ISKILMPETAEGRAHAASLREAATAMKSAEPVPPRKRIFQIGGHSGESGMIEAAANGAAQGVQLAINVAAMLMAFVALVALINAILGWGGALVGIDGLSLQSILGTLLRPLAW